MWMCERLFAVIEGNYVVRARMPRCEQVFDLSVRGLLKWLPRRPITGSFGLETGVDGPNPSGMLDMCGGIYP